MSKPSAPLWGMLILGASLLGSSVIMGQALKDSRGTERPALAAASVIPSPLMSEEEAASYLHLSADAFQALIKQQTADKASIGGSFDTYRFIPYLTMDKRRFFTKEHLDKWMEYQMLNH